MVNGGRLCCCRNQLLRKLPRGAGLPSIEHLVANLRHAADESRSFQVSERVLDAALCSETEFGGEVSWVDQPISPCDSEHDRQPMCLPKHHFGDGLDPLVGRHGHTPIVCHYQLRVTRNLYS